MPSRMPENLRRRKYENFCIECVKCDTGTRACYLRRPNHWYTREEKTTSPVNCGYCSETIPDGTRTVVQRIYAWPDSETDSESKNGQAHYGGAAVGMAVGTAVKPAPAGWHNLSRSTQLNADSSPVVWVAGSEPALQRWLNDYMREKYLKRFEAWESRPSRTS